MFRVVIISPFSSASDFDISGVTLPSSEEVWNQRVRQNLALFFRFLNFKGFFFLLFWSAVTGYTHNSLTFGNRFIVVRVAVNPEHIPETLVVWREYSLEGTPVYSRTPCTHSGTPRGPSTGRKKPENPEEPYMDTRSTCTQNISH